MNCVADQVQVQNSGSQLGSGPLQLITAKLLHRFSKLELLQTDHGLKTGWLSLLQGKATAVHNFTTQRWKSTETSTAESLKDIRLQSLQPEADLNIDMSELDVFIDNMKSWQQIDRSMKTKLSGWIIELPANDLPGEIAPLSESTEHE